MKQYIKSLSFPFAICFLATLLFPIFIPSCRILAFAPLITLIISRYSLAITLWSSLTFGFIIDSLSFSTPFGFFALNYCLSSLLIYRYRKYFLEEKVLIFALYSTLFSFVSTFIIFILFALIEIQLKLNIFILFSDLILMPIVDGIYSFLCVLFPMAIYRYILQPKKRLQIKVYYWKLRRKLKMRWEELKAHI